MNIGGSHWIYNLDVDEGAKEQGASRSGMTKSGVLRRNAPSRWRKDGICL